MGPKSKLLGLINAVGELEKIVKQQRECITGFRDIGLEDEEHADTDDMY